jgi:hypothetical protein
LLCLNLVFSFNHPGRAVFRKEKPILSKTAALSQRNTQDAVRNLGWAETLATNLRRRKGQINIERKNATDELDSTQ